MGNLSSLVLLDILCDSQTFLLGLTKIFAEMCIGSHTVKSIMHREQNVRNTINRLSGN